MSLRMSFMRSFCEMTALEQHIVPQLAQHPCLPLLLGASSMSASSSKSSQTKLSCLVSCYAERVFLVKRSYVVSFLQKLLH